MAMDEQNQAMLEQDQINNQSFLSAELDNKPEEIADAAIS